MKVVIIVISLLILIQLYSFQGVALASTPQKQNKRKHNVKKEKINNKSMKTFLKKIEIYGRIAKPQTVFIIPGVDPRVDGIRIERRFFSDMFRKVEKSTLRKQRIKELRSKDYIPW